MSETPKRWEKFFTEIVVGYKTFNTGYTYTVTKTYTISWILATNFGNRFWDYYSI